MNPVYGMASIDVHKRMLAVVIALASERDGQQWLRRRFGTSVAELQHLVAWLREHQVQEVVMESTASYWRGVWIALEPHFRLYLAQAQSNRAPHGRKTDFGDAVRLARRQQAGELRLSYVPDRIQRRWRLVCRAMSQIQEERTREQNQIEALLEEGQIKLSAVVSDLLGASSWRILQGLVEGGHSAEQMAELADPRLRCSRELLTEALAGDLDEVCRQLLRQWLERIALLDEQQLQLRQQLSQLQREHQDVVRRLAEMPGVDVLAAQKILAVLGPEAAAFPSAGHLASWVGACPGRRESGGVSGSHRCPQGYRPLRALLNQLAWAAVRTKGSYFQQLFRRWIPKLGVKGAVWAVAHKMLRLIWRILHCGDTYVEHGALALNEISRQRKKRRLVTSLRNLGYTVTVQLNTQAAT